MVNFQNEGYGAPREPHGAPKGPKMAKIDQNLDFFSQNVFLRPRGLKPITWDWSHFEGFSEENMVNFQNEG